jgi:hypothetical protein
VRSPFAKSSFVSVRRAPPSADTIDSPVAGAAASTISLRGVHDAPRHSGPASHTMIGMPPVTSAL